MKNIRILFFLPLLVILFARCGDNRPPVQFEMEYLENRFTVNPAFNPLETHIFTFDNLPTLIKQYKSNNDISDDDILSILPQSCRFINVSGNEDYNYINEVSVKIIPFDDPSRRREIFYHQPTVNRLGLRLDLVPNDNDLKEILLQDRFTVEVHLVQFRERPATSITTRFEMRFDVR